MFHANAWSLAFSAPMAGGKLVLPGPKLDGASLYELLDQEKVTCTAAVPTVWLMLLQHLEQNPALEAALSRSRGDRRLGLSGGADAEAFVERYDTDVMHAWGMTEMSPLGTIGTRKGGTEALEPDEWWKLKLKQGRPPFTVDMKITDDEGRALPHDGETFGRLKVKGPAVARAYFKGEGAESFDADGWFDTGDVATIDGWGYMASPTGRRTSSSPAANGYPRSSWRTSRSAAPASPRRRPSACRIPKWDERPVLVVVRKPGSDVTGDGVLAFLKARVAKWWLPDDVVFVADIPHTATGKISKLALRERMKEYVLPAAR